jgi:hypothetical protein
LSAAHPFAQRQTIAAMPVTSPEPIQVPSERRTTFSWEPPFVGLVFWDQIFERNVIYILHQNSIFLLWGEKIPPQSMCFCRFINLEIDRNATGADWCYIGMGGVG